VNGERKPQRGGALIIRRNLKKLAQRKKINEGGEAYEKGNEIIK